MAKTATILIPDEQVLSGIQADDPKIIDRFIREYTPRISRFLIGKGAKERDVEDLAMTALTAAYQNIRKQGFELTSSLSSYVLQIAKYQFFKMLDRNKLEMDAMPEGKDFVDSKNFFKDLEEAEATNLLWEKFYQLGKTCQQVLTSWLDRISMSEIAQTLGMPSAGAVRAKKFQCLNSLKQAVWSDARFAELTV